MKRFHRPFFAFLFALLLVGAQQAAFAHLLSHAPGMDRVTAQYQDDHGSLDGAAETCSSCIAFAGVGGATPPTSSSSFAAATTNDLYRLPLAAPISTRLVIHSRARAPPAVL